MLRDVCAAKGTNFTPEYNASIRNHLYEDADTLNHNSFVQTCWKNTLMDTKKRRGNKEGFC